MIESLRAAQELHYAGALDRAERIYHRILRAQPSADAFHLLGALKLQKDDVRAALPLLREAVALAPKVSTFQNSLGVVLWRARRYRLAETCFRKAMRLERLSTAPSVHLGQLLAERGRFAEAARIFSRVTDREPGDFVALVELGRTLRRLKRFERAISVLRRAIALDRRSAQAHALLGAVLVATGRWRDACAHYLRSLRQRPEQTAVCNNVGVAYWWMGRVDDAVTYFRRALATSPHSAATRSNLLLTLNYRPGNRVEVFREHRRWSKTGGTPVHSAARPNARSGGRLRIGYVSPDFGAHPVGRFIEPILRSHDRRGFEIICYACARRTDRTARRLRALADRWRDLTGVGDDEAADLIRNDRVDVLVDLAGHTARNRLSIFERRPAPIQVTYLGYPNTTGMRTIDYRLTDRYADPEGLSERFYSEELVRLETGFLCYEPPKNSPTPSRPPALRTGSVAFGSFNALPKLTDEVLETWASILRRTPGSTLTLKASPLGDRDVKRKLMRQFERRGIDPRRLVLVGSLPRLEDHLRLYGTIDIALDPFPYNGTSTTCEALWMGLAVVALAGETHAGRVGVSLLTRLGLEDLIASSLNAYVERAVCLADDLDTLAELRAGLRERMKRSGLTDGVTFTRSLEKVYRWMWSRWLRRSVLRARSAARSR